VNSGVPEEENKCLTKPIKSQTIFTSLCRTDVKKPAVDQYNNKLLL
jgi:hypothetical protein